jgi:hypothetical protein
MIVLERLKSTIILFSITALFACSDNEEKPRVAPPGKIIATYSGKSFESSDAVGFFDGGRFLMGGIGNNGSQITLSIESTDPGTYKITGALSGNVINTVTVMPENYDAQTNDAYSSTIIQNGDLGSIVVTELDETNKTISGTFSVRVKRTMPKAEEMEVSGSFTQIPYTPAPPPSAPNSFTAKVGGNTFTPSSVNAISSFGMLMINAMGTSRTLAIVVPSGTSTGTFSLEDGMIGDYRGVITEGTKSFESVSGSVTITKHDKTKKRIEGIFSFTAEEFPSGGSPITVTGGTFAVSY